MANMPKLVAELRDDPISRAYSGMTNSEVVTSLYTKNRTRNISRMTSSEIFQNVNMTEWGDLTEAKQDRIIAILSWGEVNPFGNEARVFTSIFGAGSATITALAAARVETVSRAVELGLGEVTVGDVIAAREQF